MYLWFVTMVVFWYIMDWGFPSLEAILGFLLFYWLFIYKDAGRGRSGTHPTPDAANDNRARVQAAAFRRRYAAARAQAQGVTDITVRASDEGDETK